MTKELIVVDHTASGLTKVLTQYKDSALFNSLLTPFLDVLADFEDQFTKFKSELTLDTAEGRNLDLIGDTLNAQSRPVDDEEYRNLLRALIIAYNSSGSAQDIYAILDNITTFDSVYVRDDYGASFSVWVEGAPADTDWDSILRTIYIAKAAGIQFNGITSKNDQYLPYFGFDLDQSPDAGPFSVGRQTNEADSYTWTYPISGSLGNSQDINMDYTFLANGSITPTTRITLQGSLATNITIEFTHGPSDNFRQNLYTLSDGTTFTVVDKSGVTWAITGQSNTAFSQGGTSEYSTTIMELWNTGTVKYAVILKDGVSVDQTVLFNDFDSYNEQDEAIFNTNNPNNLRLYGFMEGSIYKSDYEDGSLIYAPSSFSPANGLQSGSSMFQGYLTADQNSVIFESNPNGNDSVGNDFNWWPSFQSESNSTGYKISFYDKDLNLWTWEKVSGSSATFFDNPTSGAGKQYYWDYGLGSYLITKNGVVKTNTDVANEFIDYGTSTQDYTDLVNNNPRSGYPNNYFYYGIGVNPPIPSRIIIQVLDSDVSAFQSKLNSLTPEEGIFFEDKSDNSWYLKGVDDNTPLAYTVDSSSYGVTPFNFDISLDGSSFVNRAFVNDVLVTNPSDPLTLDEYESDETDKSVFDTNNVDGLTTGQGNIIIIEPPIYEGGSYSVLIK